MSYKPRSSPFDRLGIEVGSAYGETVFKLAKSHPGTFFVGVEIDRDRYKEALRKAEICNEKNLTFVSAEAHEYLESNFTPGTVDEVHVYFPTPYPKSLNTNSSIVDKVDGRLISPSFVHVLETIMALGGIMRIVTDHRDYFASISRIIDDSSFMPVAWTNPLHGGGPTGGVIQTRWERRQLRNGKRIYFVQCVR
jgi:tRNA (guanine-N7-)-methyltransferase